MTEKSRRPSSDMASVRGIGVAVSVSTSTSARRALSCSSFDTEAVFFIIDQKPQPRKLDVVLNQAMGTDNDIRAAIGHFIERYLAFFGGTEAG